MTPEALLATCERAGITLSCNGGKLKIRGEESALVRMLPLLRAHKEKLQSHFKGDWIEHFEERAAILEFDAGLSRSEAELQVHNELEERKGR